MDKLEKFLQESQQNARDPIKGEAHIGCLLNVVFDRMVSLSKDQNTVPGLSTGFLDIDCLIGGMEKGELVVVTASPQTGSTALALTIVRNTARDSAKPIVVFSQKLTSVQIVKRLLSMVSQVNIRKMESGKLSEKEWAALFQGSKILEQMNLRVYDSIFAIEGIAQICEKSDGPALILIDSISHGKLTGECPSDLLVDLKRLAQIYQTIVICTCCPLDVEAYAFAGVDKVLHLDRPGTYSSLFSENGAACVIERNPYGDNGMVNLFWDPETLTFWGVGDASGKGDNKRMPNEAKEGEAWKR